jgi:PEP-CTERM motif-containing protein
MKRFQWAIATLLSLLAPCAYGDSTSTFNITQATVFVGPGSDNVLFTLAGPGTTISGTGGIQCQVVWCNGQIFPRGSLVQDGFGFDGQIFIDGFSTARIGGHDFDPELVGFSGPANLFALNTSGDVLLGGGSTTTICQDASISSQVSGQAGQGGTFTTFLLELPAGGKFCSTWVFYSGPGGYAFAGGKFVAGTAVPEPGTLGLMVMGLAGIVGVIRRRRAR